MNSAAGTRRLEHYLAEQVMSHAQDQARAYDEVPYESSPFAYTHPGAMATVATLYGLTPPDVESCRVLELGCAEGGNLIPMAVSLPGSRFVGVDLSPRQIACGQAMIDRLGLTNVELRTLDLMEIEAELGDFDYIVCHGVYSWVPRPVQEKIMTICSERLRADGVAYISYNTYPGWHFRGMIREMVNFHDDRQAPPLSRVRRARQFLDFLVRNCREPKSVFAVTLEQEWRLWEKSSDAYVLHEQLAEVNDPIYFHQFNGRLAEHRLQFVAEAKLGELPTAYANEVDQRLAEWCSDFAGQEQYHDFLADRAFRRSLICHKHVRLQRPPSQACMAKFFLVANAAPVAPEPRLSSDAVEQFQTRQGNTFSTNNPWLKTALAHLLHCWPRPVAYGDVCEHARRSVIEAGGAEGDPISDDRLLAQPLLQCGLNGFVEFRVHRSPEVAEAGNRPCASPLARLQAESAHIVTSLRHLQVELEEADRRLLGRLDGSLDRGQLEVVFQDIVASVKAGSGMSKLSASSPGDRQPPANVEEQGTLAECLRRLATVALLTA